MMKATDKQKKKEKSRTFEDNRKPLGGEEESRENSENTQQRWGRAQSSRHDIRAFSRRGKGMIIARQPHRFSARDRETPSTQRQKTKPLGDRRTEDGA